MILINQYAKTDKAETWGGLLDPADDDTFFIIANMKDGSWKMFNVWGEITRTIDGVIFSDAIDAARMYARTEAWANSPDPNGAIESESGH
jgi:hypothetical protein